MNTKLSKTKQKNKNKWLWFYGNQTNSNVDKLINRMIQSMKEVKSANSYYIDC